MSRRALLGAAVLVAWIVGLGLLARRELGRGDIDRLREAALRVNPGAVFYAVTHAGRQIGFASSTIDTTTSRVIADDYLSADIPAGGTIHRAIARTRVGLTRGLALREFDFKLESDGGPVSAVGTVDGDSLLTVILSIDDAAPDTQRIRLTGPIFPPTLAPLAVILSGEPDVGVRRTVTVFDPTTMTPKPITMRIAAESVFVVDDSAKFDSAGGRWIPALRDTVRAWRLVTEGSDTFTGWVDAQGRVVESAQSGGLMLRRMAYELAFENWRADAGNRERRARDGDDVIESTAIASNVPLRPRNVSEIRVRLRGVSLAGFDLDGERQRLVGDTLIVRREDGQTLKATFTLPASRVRFRRELAAEPLIQSGAPEIAFLAMRIVGNARDPVEVARRLNQWVHDSLAKEITVGLPSAIQVLRSRRGDCNEHTQLFLALARALGLPSRAAAGLALVNGKFYYHAWPEVYLDRWVAIDPTFGQFPADAGHLRFTVGGLARQAELLRLIGALEIDVVGTS